MYLKELQVLTYIVIGIISIIFKNIWNFTYIHIHIYNIYPKKLYRAPHFFLHSVYERQPPIYCCDSCNSKFKLTAFIALIVAVATILFSISLSYTTSKKNLPFHWWFGGKNFTVAKRWYNEIVSKIIGVKIIDLVVDWKKVINWNNWIFFWY